MMLPNPGDQGENFMRFPMYVAMMAVMGILGSCAHLDPHPMDMTQAIQNAETSEDHMALAKHYEATAEQMLAKARASARELEEYEMHPYYGVRTQDLKAHCRTAVSEYRRAAEVNLEMARSHREMAERISKEKSVKDKEAP